MPKVFRSAFVGFRHPHIFDAFKRIKAHERFRVVACCEEDPSVRRALFPEIEITHERLEDLLREDFEVLVVGDVFAKRGKILTEAMEAGRHVLSDKPICIRLEELKAIEERLSSGQTVLGAMLDMRDSGIFIKLRELIRGGAIGEIQAVSFGGQHPLLRGERAEWYFQEGQHGGTINDVAIHAVDMLSWITGRYFQRILAARCWRSNSSESYGFDNAGQMMLEMEGGCGVLGDVSYLSPDSFRYALPLYWRFTFWGRDGVLEGSLNAEGLSLYESGRTAVRSIPPAAPRPGGYLESFLEALEGRSGPESLTTAEILAATRICLKIQEAAAKGAFPVDLF